jgi:hypothetical protein
MVCSVIPAPPPDRNPFLATRVSSSIILGKFPDLVNECLIIAEAHELERAVHDLDLLVVFRQTWKQVELGLTSSRHIGII